MENFLIKISTAVKTFLLVLLFLHNARLPFCATSLQPVHCSLSHVLFHGRAKNNLDLTFECEHFLYLSQSYPFYLCPVAEIRFVHVAKRNEGLGKIERFERGRGRRQINGNRLIPWRSGSVKPGCHCERWLLRQRHRPQFAHSQTSRGQRMKIERMASRLRTTFNQYIRSERNDFTCKGAMVKSVFRHLSKDG